MEFEDGASDNSLNNAVRFVLLLHELPDGAAQSTHWDLMIHQADSLLTFALQSLPPQTHTVLPPQTRKTPQTHEAGGLVWPATRLPNHRLRYLEYEGVVSPAHPGGPERGGVRRVAAGWAVCEAVQLPQPWHRWHLSAPELQAVFAYKPGPVGEATQLHIESWHS